LVELKLFGILFFCFKKNLKKKKNKIPNNFN